MEGPVSYTHLPAPGTNVLAAGFLFARMQANHCFKEEVMAKQREKLYNPKEVEDRTYQFWMNGGYFTAKPDPELSLIHI